MSATVELREAAVPASTRPPQGGPPSTWGQTTARHALFWLMGANAVGLLLSLLLLWPEFGDLLLPFTYGRWMPVHANAQLYGWCSLPLIGLLHAWYRPPVSHSGLDTAFRVATAGWSASLALGVCSWLMGSNSGKLFVEWHGLARGALPVAMAGLWSVLAAATWLRRFGRQLRSWGWATAPPVAAARPLNCWPRRGGPSAGTTRQTRPR